PGDDPRLARAGPGEHELRPVAVGDGLDLVRVELVREVEGGAFHGGILPQAPPPRPSLPSPPIRRERGNGIRLTVNRPRFAVNASRFAMSRPLIVTNRPRFAVIAVRFTTNW